MKQPIDLEGIRALISVIETICDTGEPSDMKELAKTNASTISNLCDEVERLQALLDRAEEDIERYKNDRNAIMFAPCISADMNANEIVMALRCCNRSKGHRCSECPVFSRYEHRICKATVDRFAADLIETLQAQLAASQRREMAAVEDLEYACGSSGEFELRSICDICRRKQTDGTCPTQCEINSLAASNKWQWRGPQDEEGDSE